MCKFGMHQLITEWAAVVPRTRLLERAAGWNSRLAIAGAMVLLAATPVPAAPSGLCSMAAAGVASPRATAPCCRRSTALRPGRALRHPAGAVSS